MQYHPCHSMVCLSGECRGAMDGRGTGVAKVLGLQTTSGYTPSCDLLLKSTTAGNATASMVQDHVYSHGHDSTSRHDKAVFVGRGVNDS